MTEGVFRFPTSQGKPTADKAPPFLFVDPGNNFWQSHMLSEISRHGCLVTLDAMKNIKIQGDGVRLHIPFDMFVMMPEDDLYLMIIQGIRVSLARREELGY